MAPKIPMRCCSVSANGTLRARAQSGISLIEVLVVVALLVIGLWLMMNVFPMGQRALRVLRERNLARTIAERLANELAISAKFEGGLLPDNPALYELPLAVCRQLDLPVDKDGDGNPDESPDGKRMIEDLLELRRRLRIVMGENLERLGGWALTALTPIKSIGVAYRYQPYTEAGDINEVTIGSNKYFVDRSKIPPEIVVKFGANQTKWYRISYITQIDGQKLIADEELNRADSDASGEARIVPWLLKNALGQIGLAVLSVKEVVQTPLPSLSDEEKRSGVITLLPPPPTRISYELGSDGAWMMCWGRSELEPSGETKFDPLPKPLIEKKFGDSGEAGVAAFSSSLVAIPDTEFEIKPDGKVVFSTLAPDTLIRLSYKSARSPNQTIENWFFVAFVPPLSFTPSPSIVGEQPVELWREYFLDFNDRQRIFVQGMWAGLLLNVEYAGTSGNRYSILQRVEYDPQRGNWKGVINLPEPYEYIEKIEGASIKVWVSGRFFLGTVGGKRPLNLGSVIEKEALIKR